MSRRTQSLDVTVEQELRAAVAGVAPAIAQMIAARAAAEIDRTLQRTGVPSARRSAPARRSRPRVELTRWVADRNARRVPSFVIEMVGLDTKKKIIARYGENAVFELGRSAPKPRPEAAKANGDLSQQPRMAARVVKAKGPVVRKSAAAPAPK
jgi:hypothetical protein